MKKKINKVKQNNFSHGKEMKNLVNIIKETNEEEQKHSESRLFLNAYLIEMVDDFDNHYLVNEKGHIVKIIKVMDQNNLIDQSNYLNSQFIEEHLKIANNVSENFLQNLLDQLNKKGDNG